MSIRRLTLENPIWLTAFSNQVGQAADGGNTTNLPNVRPMLAHRLRRCPSIGQTSGRFVVFAGRAFTDAGRAELAAPPSF